MYRDVFEEHFMMPDDMEKLNYTQLREMQLPIGHAHKLLKAIQDAIAPEEDAIEDKEGLLDTQAITAHLTPMSPGDQRVATLLTAGSCHVFGRTNIDGIDADNSPAGVSKVHMSFCSVGKDFELVDEGSRNGTFVNRQRVTGRARLKEGDQITLAGPDTKVGYVYHLGAPLDGVETQFPAPIAGKETSSSTRRTDLLMANIEKLGKPWSR